jgi:hypothetical protein
MEKCSIYCFTNILYSKTQRSKSIIEHSLFSIIVLFRCMDLWMKLVIYITNDLLNMLINKKYLISKCTFVFCLLFKVQFCYNNRVNGQYTLDNIASCLFGIETNSLQNENDTLINHLKSIFNLNPTSLFFLVVCKCISIKTSNFICP